MKVIVEPSKYRLPIARPLVGVAGKTGTWRLERPVVDNNKCTRCYLCEIHCPVNVIRVEPDAGVSIDYDYCKGCGLCADVCPVLAIKMVPEE
ncbi:pyruvate/ketoisovalerate ferredoxin oxidoreductase subunit delta [Thermogladius calderae 1633]|uniref:Pyruvate/ketoisovalerate ferredoxin oxidoreductase subunit delta n=1 Tax=Thermogladius calderae (strain DSM 22663 / VKM B-2946 / 1633) TaxID=1184251 RepID=I3TD95_THEC1|nr:4Fe-4S binding protein [Thermogladius calderae]AFK50733.1 pyruvate/ketoisovalerate ferredoxin oxidoreductase subunit delta [Thermogladius calderae 1633]